MVIDLEGGMISRYYRPGYDIIINPFDKTESNILIKNATNYTNTKIRGLIFVSD